ncbi:unnamed protein product [Urochloa humidicola]
MMVEKTIGTGWSNLQSNLAKNSTHEEGAHQVFNEMTKSDFEDWRPPNRALKVTIRKVCYPITESVLRQVFGSFGVVEQVLVFGGTDVVLAQVVFQSKYDAVDAFGDLHGRNIYDGCCQLDIQYGVSSKPNVPLATSNGDTRASSPSVLFCSSAVVISTLNDDISSEMLPVETTAIEAAHGNVKIVAQPVTILDVVSCDIADELLVHTASTQVQAPSTSTITTEAFTDVSVAAASTLAINLAASNVTIDAPSTCSTECLGTDIVVHSNLDDKVLEEEMLSGFNTLFNCGIGLELLVKPPCKYLLSGYNINSYMLLTGCVPLNMHGESIVILWELVEQQPWPPTMQRKLTCDEADANLRPRPWPSFRFVLHFLFSLGVLKPLNMLFLEALLVVPELIGEKYYLFSYHTISCELCTPGWVVENSLQIWCIIGEVGIELRPSPWPSFATAHEITARWCCSLHMKPPWPPPARQKFSYMPVKIVKSLECMVLTSCTSKCSSTQRELHWLSYWNYGAVLSRFIVLILPSCWTYGAIRTYLNISQSICRTKVQLVSQCYLSIHSAHDYWSFSWLLALLIVQNQLARKLRKLIAILLGNEPFILVGVSGMSRCGSTAILPNYLALLHAWLTLMDAKFSIQIGQAVQVPLRFSVKLCECELTQQHPDGSSCYNTGVLAAFFMEIKIKLMTSIKRLQAPWDPGGIDLIHRLGGKPILKKGGMLGTSYAWAVRWAMGLVGRGPDRNLQEEQQHTGAGRRIFRTTYCFSPSSGLFSDLSFLSTSCSS